MDKIGIINFHRAPNYGAVLQAYALSETIKKLGGNPVTLDYINISMDRAYNPKNYNHKSIKSLLATIIIYSRLKKKNKCFEDFRIKYLDLYEIKDLQTLEREGFIKFIVGSDQVWNYMITQFDKAYFLNFVSDFRKKNSYAASFGFDHIPDEYIDEYKELLADFNHISVREAQGAAIIMNLLNRKAEVVLDPTMLLLKDDWNKLSRTYMEKKDYILIYQLAASQSLLDFAVVLSQETKCEIVIINDAIIKKIKAKYVTGIGPQEFLSLFLNAKYIITNSFHGTAFSINLNKMFFVEMSQPTAKVNSRLENILDTFELRNRQIVNGKNDNIFSKIDYFRINKKIEIERQKSLNYLKRILEE